MEMQEYVGVLDAELPQLPAVRPGGSLLMMVGLPGSGKSSVVYSLCTLTDCVVVSTDGIRQQMSQHPSYTLSAMSLVYEICYALIRKRLQQGQRVIFDASNYLSSRRQRLFCLAAETATPVAVCHVYAAQDVIESRLKQRANGVRGAGDVSEANWAVYVWMQAQQEPLQQEHLAVDTSSTPPAILAQNLYHYWSQIEANAASYFDLQPPRRATVTRFDD